MTHTFPSLDSQIAHTLSGLPATLQKQAKTVVAPYRICPIGAHIDHQGGPVLGVAIDAYTILSFVPSVDGMVRLTSADFSGEITFDASIVSEPKNDWGRYCRGAVHALHTLFPDQIKLGWTGHITGRLLGAGLSSSASVGVAYLMAFAEVNGLTLSKAELVELDRIIENEYLGLNNGIQDQTTIVFGQADGIIQQDTLQRQVAIVPHSERVSDLSWLVIFSGFTRELTSSDFNKRVGECWEAAGLMTDGAKILNDVPRQTYENLRDTLPDYLARRADHFFSESARVMQGADAWRMGNLEQFGALMTESCASSMTQYECGSEPLIALHRIAAETDGVLGSRFSGGGYGGCLLALAESSKAEAAIEGILRRYRPIYPDKAHICDGWIANGVDGARLIK